MIIFNKKRDIRHSYIPLSAVGQNRTVDTRIFSPLLYRLSYNGKNNVIFIFDFLMYVKSLLLSVAIRVNALVS